LNISQLMAKIPENVNEWSRGILVDLLDEGYDENLRLEFKSKIDSNTKRIPITACAFANTKGGFLIFGLDNDRKKKLTTEQRLVGLDDSDQLKSQINNQIRIIKPSIPIENIEFKESNIPLPNGKVIVILKISKTLVSPHQFKEIFYKRVANGNAPMDVEEIKNAIIESQKSSRMLSLLEGEEELLMDVLNTMTLLVVHGQGLRALNLLKHIDYSTFKHFLYNYSHFYSIEANQALSGLVYDLSRLHRNEAANRETLENPDDYEKEVKIFKENIENSIRLIKKINPLFGIRYIERKSGLFDIISKEIKTEMSKEIKEKKASEEEIKEKKASEEEIKESTTN